VITDMAMEQVRVRRKVIDLYDAYIKIGSLGGDHKDNLWLCHKNGSAP